MRQTTWTTRRALWTAGVGFAGFFLGTQAGPVGSALGALWGGGIGYGFGSVFDQKNPTSRVVVYWTSTLALVGPFFGLLVGAAIQPYASTTQRIFACAIGLVLGVLLGLFIGTIQLKRIRRRFQATQPDPS
jgi:hypothetical protein